MKSLSLLLVCLLVGSLVSCENGGDQNTSPSAQDCRMKDLACSDGFTCQVLESNVYECVLVEDHADGMGSLPPEIQLLTSLPQELAVRDVFTLSWSVSSQLPIAASHAILCEGESEHCGTSIYYSHRIQGSLINQDESTNTSTYEAEIMVEEAGNYSIAVNADLGQGREDLLATPSSPINIYVPVIPTERYPEGPYGTEVGQIFPRVDLMGFADTFIDADFDALNEPERMVSSAEFYQENNPDVQLLLITVSAEWCPSCNAEAELLKTLYEEYYHLGLRVFSIYFEDAETDPVDVLWLEDYARRYRLSYSLAVTTPDSDLIGNSIPTHYLVDPITMEIVDDPLDLRQAVSDRLSN